MADATQPERTDVLIVGGGMVGAALAAALGQAGFQVAVIEAHEPAPHDDASFDTRVSAISRASQHIFEHLGAWAAMQAERATPYQRMRVWEDEDSEGVRFDAAEIGEPDLGHIIENGVIQRALWARLSALPEVARYCPAALAGIEATADGVTARLEDGRELQAEVLIGADGGRSRVRELAGIALDTRDYQQQAVVGTVRAARGHGATAWQRFLPSGPLALLPLGEDHFSIVWSTDPAHADELMALDDSALADALMRATGGRLGALTCGGPRGRFPLRAQHAKDYVRPRLALVGDAAHVIHPLAGQGVNLGLLDIAVLRDVLLEARTRQRGLGALGTLRRYERARRGDNTLTQASMTGFKLLFGNRVTPLHWLRNTGLELTDRFAPLKRGFMQTALGTGADVPALARPLLPQS